MDTQKGLLPQKLHISSQVRTYNKMLTLSVVDLAFGPVQVKAKTIKLMCVASPLRNTDELDLRQDNMSKLSDMSICGLLFQ